MGSGPRRAHRGGGLEAEPLSIARSRCLPLPRVASGRLGLSQSAATFNPAVPDTGRFLRRLVERPREASSTRLEAGVEEWQSSATNADPKIGTQDAAVKRWPVITDLRSCSHGDYT
jgi:hypothetical protein